MKTYILGIVCLGVIAMVTCGLVFDPQFYFTSVILCSAAFTAKSIFI